MTETQVRSSLETLRARIAVSAVLVAVPLVLFFNVLFLDRALLTSSQNLMFPWAFGEKPEKVLAERSFRWDPTLNYYPRRVLAHEAILDGRLPLWNPYTASGMPLLADFQSAVYYPPNLVLNLGDPLRAMGWAVFLHVLLAGFGMYGFLRVRALPREASVLGAVAYMMNGFLMTRIGHPTMVQAAAWLPALFFVADRVLVSGAPRWFALLSAAVALAILSGFPQITVHCFAALGLYLIYRWAAGRLPARVPLRAIALAAVGVGLAGLQILPTWEFAAQSGRLGEALRGELWRTPAVSFARLLVPGLTGNPVDGTNWLALFKGPSTHPNDIGLVAYVGVLPLVLALGALARLARDGEVRFFSGLAVLVVLGSLFRPVFSILYLFLPGAGAAQADRLAFLLSFCLAFLAAKGLAELSADFPRAARGFLVASVGVIGVLLASLGVLAVAGRQLLSRAAASLSPPLSSGLWERALSPRVRGFLSGELGAWYGYEARQLLWPFAFLLAALLLLVLWRLGRGGRWLRWAAVGVAAVDLLLFAGAYYTPQPISGTLESTPGIEFLRENREPRSRIVRAFSDQVLASNLNAVLGIEDAQGYNALMVDRYGKLFDLIERGTYAQRKKIDAPTNPESFASPVLDLLNVGYIITEGTREMAQRLDDRPPFSGDGLQRVFARDLLIYRNDRALPRVLWLAKARFFHSDLDVAAEMARPGYDPAEAVLLEDDPWRVPWWVASGRGSGRAASASPHPNSVAIEVASDMAGWVRWAETDYPGWRVRVDGAEVLSWRSDLALRAIPVPAGRHRIELVMDPVSTRVGVGLTVFSLVFLLLLAGASKRETPISREP